MFWLCVGIIIVASIAVLSLIIIIRIRSTTGICCCDSDNENTQNSSGRSDSTEDPVKLTGSGIHAKTVSKNFITDDIAEGDERNPDVIPLTNGEFPVSFPRDRRKLTSDDDFLHYQYVTCHTHPCKYSTRSYSRHYSFN